MATMDDVFALLEAHPDLAFSLGTLPEDMVETAERELGVVFPPSYRRFLSRYGYMGFGSEEFKGLSPTGVRGTATDVVWSTLQRRRYGLPSDLVEVLDPGIGDWIYCLDTSSTDTDGECPVVKWIPGPGAHSERPVPVNDDFSDFALARLQLALEE